MVSAHEFVDGIKERFGRCCDDVRAGGETVVVGAVIFDGHMYLAYIVAAFVDGLDKELFEEHLAAYDEFNGVDGCIYRTVARRCRFEFLAGDVEADAGHRVYAYARCHLQEVKLDAAAGFVVFAGNHQHVVIVDLLLAVGKFEELLVSFVERFRLKVDAERVQTVFERGASAAGGEYDGVFVYAYILGVDDFVAFAVF